MSDDNSPVAGGYFYPAHLGGGVDSEVVEMEMRRMGPYSDDWYVSDREEMWAIMLRAINGVCQLCERKATHGRYCEQHDRELHRHDDARGQ